EQITEQIHKMAKYVNKPSPNWKADDFNGQRHSLDDYRGKVMLLDFWYRACPWCIRAMPLIKQVAEHFKERPVVVLGVNTDKNREDALFVIQKTNPNYTNLSGRDLTKKYGVTNYPTFIIIDRNGFVRQIRIGYEPKLFDALVEMIEALL
ncbi:MAG: TlpA family protein disulfide reductase, partial [Candidatus Hodarchaeota archaeon]